MIEKDRHQSLRLRVSAVNFSRIRGNARNQCAGKIEGCASTLRSQSLEHSIVLYLVKQHVAFLFYTVTQLLIKLDSRLPGIEYD